MCNKKGSQNCLFLIFKDYYFALLNKIEKKLIKYSETIFDTNIPKEGIIKTLQFFQSLGMKINFEDFNLNKYEVYKINILGLLFFAFFH